MADTLLADPLVIDISNRDEQTVTNEARMTDLLGRTARVVLTDGRIIAGNFRCVDDSCNIILHDSYQVEMNGDKHVLKSRLGQVLVGGKFIVKIELEKDGMQYPC